MNLGVLASHEGTTLQSLHDAFRVRAREKDFVVETLAARTVPGRR